mgnify:CR=1 FL=1
MEGINYHHWEYSYRYINSLQEKVYVNKNNGGSLVDFALWLYHIIHYWKRFFANVFIYPTPKFYFSIQFGVSLIRKDPAHSMAWNFMHIFDDLASPCQLIILFTVFVGLRKLQDKMHNFEDYMIGSHNMALKVSRAYSLQTGHHCTIYTSLIKNIRFACTIK